jgi:hypothetical protein
MQRQEVRMQLTTTTRKLAEVVLMYSQGIFLVISVAVTQMKGEYQFISKKLIQPGVSPAASCLASWGTCP